MAGISSKKEREERLKRVREKMSKEKGGKRDPFEFRPPKATADEDLSYYMRVLPELNKGEKCEGGVATVDYDSFFYRNGAHWVDNRKIECPRIHDEDECAICELGFDLLNDTKDEDERKKIARKYLPRTYYAINVYFLNVKENPEDLRGKVRWSSVAKTIYDEFDKCICSDDTGSELDPKAYGLFYDCEDGYVFKYNVKKKGEWNTYEGSGFLPKSKGPLVKTEKGELDVEAAQKLLDQRHDLVTKYDSRDKEKIAKFVNKIAGGGDDSSSDFDADEEKSPSADDPIEESPNSVEEAPKEESIKEESIEETANKKSETKEKPKEESPSISKEEEDEELANLLEEIKDGKK